MSDETIYVPLRDEGIDVWRPVLARRVSGDSYLILDQDYDRDVETWEFEPGTARDVPQRGTRRAPDPGRDRSGAPDDGGLTAG